MRRRSPLTLFRPRRNGVALAGVLGTSVRRAIWAASCIQAPARSVAGQVPAVPHALAVALAVSAFWVHIGRGVCVAELACAGHALHGRPVSEAGGPVMAEQPVYLIACWSAGMYAFGRTPAGSFFIQTAKNRLHALCSSDKTDIWRLVHSFVV